jgi:aspartate carbamoyltransferase catalytic subunit
VINASHLKARLYLASSPLTYTSLYILDLATFIASREHDDDYDLGRCMAATSVLRVMNAGDGKSVHPFFQRVTGALYR